MKTSYRRHRWPIEPAYTLFPDLPYERAKRIRSSGAVGRPGPALPECYLLFAPADSVTSESVRDRVPALAERAVKGHASEEYRRISLGNSLWIITRTGNELKVAVMVDGEEEARQTEVHDDLAAASAAFRRAVSLVESRRRSAGDSPNARGRNHRIVATGSAVVRTEQEALELFARLRGVIDTAISRHCGGISSDVVPHDEVRSISEIAAFNACLRWREDAKANLATYVSHSIQRRVGEVFVAAMERRKKARFVSVDAMVNDDGESLGYSQFTDSLWGSSSVPIR